MYHLHVRIKSLCCLVNKANLAVLLQQNLQVDAGTLPDIDGLRFELDKDPRQSHQEVWPFSKLLHLTQDLLLNLTIRDKRSLQEPADLLHFCGARLWGRARFEPS